MLRQANTGDDMLAILDTLASDKAADVAGGYADAANEPTLDPIAF